MFNIEYTSGLIVSITVTTSPGAGESWVTGDPVISWGDGATTGSVLDGRAYSHTYASYDTYTIGLDGENTPCGKTAGDEKSITLVEDCPDVTASFPNTPEISFDGTTATCRVTINAGAGETLDESLTSIVAWNGSAWVEMYDQLSYSVQSQTVDLTWEMAADTNECFVSADPTNGCGNYCGATTSYYEYTEFCPLPTCSFRIN